MSADKLYALLHRQIDHHAYPAALKTTAKLLALDAKDALALATRTQLLVALDRYRDALALDSTHDDPLARAYCLYKLARPHDARKKLETARVSTAHTYDPRAVDVLEAQLHYRLGEYEQARDLFDDLAATADQDSPELADLQANSSAASAHLDFLASLPSHLAAASASESDSSTSAPLVPSIDELESRPLALVLPASLTGASSSSAAAARLAASASAAAPSSSAAPPSKPRTRRPLPKSFDPSRPPPADAADRWIPKRERPSMRDALLQAKEKARGKKRERVRAREGMQGAATGTGEGEHVTGAAKGAGKNAGSAAGGGGGGAGAGGGKKKKGRK
ncbi:uncharacterized protein JCM10292_003532 [Rhodotorula paludigena]|uniref:uncharacterized protein n=1 Tax=Rhodotorula paludigena TaxID=86838 RepID=UPI00316DDF91